MKRSPSPALACRLPRSFAFALAFAAAAAAGQEASGSGPGGDPEIARIEALARRHAVEALEAPSLAEAAPGGTSDAEPGPGAAALRLVRAATELVGVRYRRGGTSAATGFDCSGFTRSVFESTVGLLLPRRADEQAKAAGLLPVAREDLKPGDLVFFNTLKKTFSHVGIYIGDNRFVHAPSSGKRVRTEELDLAYWARHYTGARRVLTDARLLD